MALPGGVSILALVAACIISLGVLLHIIGLATPKWLELDLNWQLVSIGLWCKVSIGSDTCVIFSLENESDELKNSVRACRAFAILGMLASFLGLAMAVTSVVFPIMGKPKNAMFSVISLVGCVAAFVCILIAVVVWGAKVKADFSSEFKIGYSFILSIIGGILIVAGGVLAYLDNKRVS